MKIHTEPIQFVGMPLNPLLPSFNADVKTSNPPFLWHSTMNEGELIRSCDRIILHLMFSATLFPGLLFFPFPEAPGEGRKGDPGN